MSPRGKGRKRTCDSASLVDELRREVDSTLAAENALLGAFRVMFTTKITLDGVKALPPKVLSAHLYAAYEAQALAYISFFVEDLRVLPVSVRLETLSKITGLAAELIMTSNPIHVHKMERLNDELAVNCELSSSLEACANCSPQICA